MTEQSLATHDKVWVNKFKTMSAKELSLSWIEYQNSCRSHETHDDEVEDQIDRMFRRSMERNPLRISDRKFPSPKEVIRSVSSETGVSVSEILSERRTRSIVAVRNKAIAAVYEQCRTLNGEKLSLPRLGIFFRRDHTTILHALRKMGLAK